MKKIFCILTAIICVLSCVSCTHIQETDDRISVVTTIFPAYDAARAVAGENASITLLVSPGSEIHSFEPTPKDMINIQKADLFICNGGESDAWVDKMLSGDEYKDLNVLRMTDAVDLYEEEIKEGMQAEEEEKELDEHIWTSPENMKKIAEKVMMKLCETDTENAASYKARYEIYNTKLSALSTSFSNFAEDTQIKTLVFADRFPFLYFAKEYGFDYYAAFPGCSSETEPSSATVVFLIDKVRTEKIPAVFCLDFSNGKLADNVCSETGAKKCVLHSCETVTKEDFEKGVTYIELMENNLAVLKGAYGNVTD